MHSENEMTLIRGATINMHSENELTHIRGATINIHSENEQTFIRGAYKNCNLSIQLHLTRLINKHTVAMLTMVFIRGAFKMFVIQNL